MAAAEDLRTRLRTADAGERGAVLRSAARDVRVTILKTIETAGMGHVGGDLSVSDILTTLFLGVLRLDPANPHWAQRDRFILSKGHCAAALYTVLAMRGFFATELLSSFMAPMSPLNGHPNRRKVPGVEANTGPLGHGLPIAVGCALAARLAKADWRTFVVLGDGELQEGSNWEAAMTAGHQGLSGLTAVIDRNGLQQGARTEATSALEPLDDRWRAFGWDVIDVDGHDVDALYEVFTAPPGDRARCILARTVKGKGVSFMEDRVEWHHKVPSSDQVRQAIEELTA